MSTRKIKDLSEREICSDPEHNPPSMMVWKPGVYEHICPRCGKKQIFRVEPAISK